MTLAELARFVRGETAASSVASSTCRPCWRWACRPGDGRYISIEERQVFSAKNYAVWAGMTPLYLDALWPAARTYPFGVDTSARVGPVRFRRSSSR